MPITKFLQESITVAMQAYEAKPRQDLRQTHVPFSGSPQKHPYDSKKCILVVDPYSSNTFYYEFDTSDIGHAEELPSIVNLDGEVVNMALVWVRKKSVGLRCAPFVVDAVGGG